MGLWTKIRNTAESAAVLAGNYYVPGSSVLTSKVAAKGSQKQLGTKLGIAAQIGSSAAGLGVGSSTTGIPASTVGAKISVAAQSAAAGISGLFNKSPMPVPMPVPMPTSMAEMPGNTPVMAETPSNTPTIVNEQSSNTPTIVNEQSSSVPIYDSIGNIVGGTLAVAGAGAQAAGKLATSSVNAMAAASPAPLSGTYSGPSGYVVGPSNPEVVGIPAMGGRESPIIVSGPSGQNFSMKDIMVPAMLLAGAFILKG